MPRGESSIHIERDPADVFAFVSEPENNPRWRSYVVDMRWSDDGPMQVGRRGSQTSRILGRNYTVEAEIVEWDPPRRVVWQTVAGDAKVRTECRVDPEGSGARLTIGAEGEFTAPLARLLSPLAVAVMRRQAGKDGPKLKAALEARQEGRL